MQKILNVSSFIKLPITLPQLFVSPKVYIKLSIGVEGQGSRLILRVRPVRKFFHRNSVISRAQSQCCFCSISCQKSMLCVAYLQQRLGVYRSRSWALIWAWADSARSRSWWAYDRSRSRSWRAWAVLAHAHERSYERERFLFKMSIIKIWSFILMY
jgi:hypothetical protein